MKKVIYLFILILSIFFVSPLLARASSTSTPWTAIDNVFSTSQSVALKKSVLKETASRLENDYKKCLSLIATKYKDQADYKDYCIYAYQSGLTQNSLVYIKAIIDKSSDSCLQVANNAWCQRDFLLPEQKKERLRQTVEFNVSLSINNIKKCLSLSQYKSICNREFGIKYNNVKLCLQIPDSKDGDFRYTDRYTCLYAVAKNTMNTEVCKQIDKNVKDKWGNGGDNCRTGVLKAKEKVLSKGLTDEKITQKAVKDNNFDLCLAIDGVDNYNNCHLAVAKLNNMTYCQRVLDFNASQQVFDCYEFFGHKLFSGYLFDSTDTDKDGLYDYLETQVWKTDPKKSDTDGDGFKDGAEIKMGFDPLKKNQKYIRVK